MKKKYVACFLATCLVSTVLASCNNNTTNEKELKIVYYSAGYGEKWINDLVSIFEKNHEGVKVNLEASYNAESIIRQNLNSSRNSDDLYISTGSTWKSYAATGKFADLTDFLNETVDSTSNITVKDKINDEYKDSIYYKRSDGSTKSYRLPFTSGVGGIFYNKKMFEINGWKIPETYKELMNLCETIVKNPVAVPGDPDGTTMVKPFVYTGSNTDYFDYTVFDWWSQIVGKDAIQNFLKYDNPENFDVIKNETYNGLKTATQRWNDLFAPEKGYYVLDRNATSAADAQRDFINGYAAMMFNGDWLYNEALNYTNSGTFDSTFELGIMKTPVLEEAKEEYKDTSYIIGEDQYIAIPASSSKKELAQEFIKLMISNQGCEIFANEGHGILAYKSDYSKMNIIDSFMNEYLNLREKYTYKFTNFSNDRKYLTNYIDIWGTSATRPFLSILNGTLNIDKAFNNIRDTVKASWNDWTSQSN